MASIISEVNPPAGLKEKSVGSESAATGRRISKKRGTAKVTGVTPEMRYFLTKPGSNGIPALDREMEDENQAIVEAFKTDSTFLILTEWRPKINNSTAGRPVIEKEAVSGSK